ncbi:MAG: arginine repressor [Oscillospiraceae bacterium]|jgi:transcriptional regulator of arginine metabolism|nr:arginine repressor [Oscillospiraceae bacterium]
MKARRHAKILELISQFNIDTQEELLHRLRDSGFEVTQATVSRDIKELRLVKTLSADGQYKYSTGKEENKDISSKFYALLKDSAQSINCAGNLVIIKTLSGMAQAICAAMDTMHWETVAGTLAGDDTIFIAVRSEHAAQQFAAELTRMMG